MPFVFFCFGFFFFEKRIVHTHVRNKLKIFFCISKPFTACCTQKMNVDMRLIHVNIQDNHIYMSIMQIPISFLYANAN